MVTPVTSRPLAFSAPAAKVPETEDSKNQERDESESRPEDENLGLVDPFLDSLLSEAPLEPDAGEEDAQLASVGIVPLVEPRDLNLGDAEGDALEVPIDLVGDEAALASPADDDQGPDVDEPLDVTESDAETFTDGAEEGPIEAPFVLDDPSGTLALQGEGEGDEYTADPIGLYVDDVELPWAKERWAEYSLGQAFSARRHLALVGNILCVAGEASHLHDTRRFELIEQVPLETKTARILALDTEAKDLLLLTSTGNLLIYSRASNPSERLAPRMLNDAMVTDLWQLAPGATQVLIRLESSHLLDFCASGLTAHTRVPTATPARLIAMSELGEPRVSLWRSLQGLELILEAGDQRRSLRLTSAMERAAGDVRPFLLGFNDLVLFGARNHGLWVCRSSNLEFLPIPGCRSLTAITIGHVGGRPMAFVGLFSELEDRAEIACIDLSTGRASRIAELCIHSDCSGPEDDPPELARIDSLVWDQSTGRLWAAGCFGLACFTQPVGSTSS